MFSSFSLFLLHFDFAMIVSCIVHFSFDLMLWHTYTQLGNTHIHEGVVPSMADIDPFSFGLSGLSYSFLPR